MTEETYEWLNENTIMGFGDKHGETWWPRDPAFNNLYPDAVPFEVAQEFFGRWRPVSVDVFAHDEDGNLFGDSDGAQMIYRHQPGSSLHRKRLGIHENGYQIHDRVKWLLENVSTVLNGGLAIASVIEIKSGKVAAVQVEMPETIEHSSGEKIRPFLAAVTSLDGSLRTTYKEGLTRIQCDNTLRMFFTEKTRFAAFKHSKNSTNEFTVQGVREALDLMQKASAEDIRAMEELLATSVDPHQWDTFLNLYIPMPEDDGSKKTRAENKRNEFQELWTNDDRVAPWSGTAWGVLQTVNTYQTHIATVKKVGRVERQWENFLTDKTAKTDNTAMEMLTAALV